MTTFECGETHNGWVCTLIDGHDGDHVAHGEFDDVDFARWPRRPAPTVEQIKAEAWDEGWRAATEVVTLEGQRVWAHTVMPEGYEGNPYRRES